MNRLFLSMSIVISLLSVAIAFSAVDAGAETLHSHETIDRNSETGAMLRWWLPAGFVSEEEIESEIKTVAETGFKGLEICIFMADTDYTQEELKQSGWGSEDWNRIYKSILKKANEYSIRIDTTIGPAWPAAVPSITPESDAASKELVAGHTETFSGSFSGELPSGEGFSYGGFDFNAGDGIDSDTESQRDDVKKEPARDNKSSEDMPDVPDVAIDRSVSNRPVLFAVTAAKVTGTDLVTKTKATSWGEAPPSPKKTTKKTTLLDVSSLIDITDAVVFEKESGKYTIDWTTPDNGSWKIFTFWMRGTRQVDRSEGSTYTSNYVVDHFGQKGTQAVIDYWEHHLLDDETKQLLRKNAGAIFEDSLEIYFEGLRCPVDFKTAFINRRGYDVTPYLPLFIGRAMGGISNVDFYDYEIDDGAGNYCEMADRIRNDYKQLLTDLYIERHIITIREWAKSLGLTYRAQAYGGPLDVINASAHVAEPEGESLGFGTGVCGDDRFRMISGAANMANRQVISDEVGAILNKGYRLTWKDMLHWINKNFSGGANQMVFHGMPYSDSDASVWPGFTPLGFDVAANWGPREPGWHNIEDLSGYIGRTQAILQNGSPQRDFAVYHHAYSTDSPVFKDQTLAKAGYTYDIISPALLEHFSPGIKDGVLAPDGPSYKAIVLNNQTMMTVNAAENLLHFADQGLKIIVIGSFPTRVPYYCNHSANDRKLKDIIQKLTDNNSVIHVEKESDIFEAFTTAGILPSVKYGDFASLHNVHRKIDGMDFYFLYNYGDTDIDMPVTLKGSGDVFSINQWTGNTDRLAVYNRQYDMVTVNIRLAPNDTTVVACSPAYKTQLSQDSAYVTDIVPDGAEACYVNDLLSIRSTKSRAYEVRFADGRKAIAAIPELQEKLSLENGWRLSVESWHDGNDPGKSSSTEKENIQVGQTELKLWKDIPLLGEGISGIGSYSNRFDLDDSWGNIAGATVDLGEVHACSVELWINGAKVPLNQITYRADISDFLNAGENSIQVIITTTLGNRLIKDGKIKIQNTFQGKTSAYESIGLVGPVTISPYGQAAIAIEKTRNDNN